ncbi:ABC transporter permease [Saccharopolyspora hirsuta]|uniref:ABC transporter permease n=1 Tax=Saccharopolyspora hirsuta TaxID=1837 RepID=A0A5M7BL72_SACHI|nr:ABC transporter permease [Saccharopolyspora hirsuta]KAA5830509.1 ABC transporter permease [Saccharopolyspora hirsuta]
MRSGALLRLALLPVVLIGVVLVAMLLPELTGVDSARSVLAVRYADADPDPQVLAAIRADLGLDQPLLQRLGERIARLCTGQLGRSWVSDVPVADLLGRALPVSLSLMLGALVLSFVVGCAAGLVAARRPESPVGCAVDLGTRVGAAVPEFALAPLLVAVFAVGLHVLPSSGWSGPQNMVLPLAALVPGLAALIAATTKARAQEVRDERFTTAARARGIGGIRLWVLHIGRPVLPAALSLSTFNAAGLLAGTATVEVVFDVPGLGRLLVDAVRAQDIPVVQVGLITVVTAALVIGAVGDALQLAVDPRTRVEAS